ncbi:MAG: response regulator transcription factor [Bacteroidetes bacterium]|nr:response regulator transcription factor [Bacteroidota bacterium]
MKKPTLVLVSDHALLREGLKVVMTVQSEFTILSESYCSPFLPKMVRELHPDIVLFDLEPVGHDPDILLRELCRLSRVLILAGATATEILARAVGYGVNAILSKDCSAAELAAAAWRVAIGCSFFSNMPFLMDISALAPSPDEKPLSRQLSGRQAEVARLVALGMTSKQIAGELAIAVKTVERHRSDILKRLNLPNASAVANYISAGNA